MQDLLVQIPKLFVLLFMRLQSQEEPAERILQASVQEGATAFGLSADRALQEQLLRGHRRLRRGEPLDQLLRDVSFESVQLHGLELRGLVGLPQQRLGHVLLQERVLRAAPRLGGPGPVCVLLRVGLRLVAFSGAVSGRR